MADREREHYVSEMYLRGFLDPKKEAKKQNVLVLYEYNQSPRYRAPKAVGWEHCFYDLTEFENPKEVEDRLGELETAAGPILKTLRSGNITLSPPERSHFAGFLALSLARTRYFRELSDHLTVEIQRDVTRSVLKAPRLVRALMAAVEEEQGAPLGTNEHSLRDFMARVADGKVGMRQESRSWSIKVMFQMMLAYMNLFERVRWVLLKPRDPADLLITCDSPVVTQDTPKLSPGPGQYEPTKSFNFFFPVSRHYLLLGEFSDKPDTTGGLSHETVMQFHEIFVGRAYKQVYAPFRSNDLQRLVDKLHHHRTGLFPEMPHGFLGIGEPPEWLKD